MAGKAQPNIYRLPTNDDHGLGTDPIPARPYYDPAYFECEREAIFRRTWLNIGHICELPKQGSFIVRPVETIGASVLVTRGKDDRIRAFHNVCTHRGTKLIDEESGHQSKFTCRYHAWTFGNEGDLLAAPDFERFYVDRKDCGLPAIAIDICAGLIFINFAPSPAQNLREFLGPLAEQLEAMPVARATHFAEWVYDIDVNWKLIIDNFQENYHLRFIHARTSAGGTGEENPFGYPTGYSFHGPHRKEFLWGKAPDTVPGARDLAFALGRDFAIEKGLFSNPHVRDYFGIYPNFMLIGSPTGHFSQVVMPLAHNRSRGAFRMYWVGEDQNASERFAREMAMVSVMDVHAEDSDVLKAGQIGLASGALEHIHFQSQEIMCRHFFQQVDTAVQAYRAGQNLPEQVA